MQHTKRHNPHMTFDDLSAERSKSFVKALQELKNLRPQLYSAAEYCEKSYLHNEEKQMVLDNLKDYAVRALVNAVDHLGTVAYKLTDLFEEQTLDVSTVEIKISCLNQQLLTSQAYTDREGLRQQQLLAFIPRHHKHYIVPNSVNKKVHFSPQKQIDARQKHIQMKLRPYPSGSPSSKTLSWHLASETKSVVNGSQSASAGAENPKATGITSNAFRLLDAEESVSSISSLNHQISSRSPASREVMRTFGATQRDSLEASKPLSTFRSFDNPVRREISRPPVRSKSMLSAFFGKNKSAKLKTSYA